MAHKESETERYEQGRLGIPKTKGGAGWLRSGTGIREETLSGRNVSVESR